MMTTQLPLEISAAWDRCLASLTFAAKAHEDARHNANAAEVEDEAVRQLSRDRIELVRATWRYFEHPG